MALRNGGFIGPLNLPTVASSPGTWDINEAGQNINNSTWPLANDPYFSSVSALVHFDEWSVSDADYLRNRGSGGDFIGAGGGWLSRKRSRAGYSAISGFTSGTLGGDGRFSSAAANAAYGFGTGDYTIELWFYPTALNSNTIVDFRPISTSGNYPNIHQNGGGDLAFFFNGADRISSAGGPLQNSTWNHVALARSGTSTKLFVAGTQVGSTYTDSNDYTSPAPITILNSGFGPGGAQSPGYVQEFRVTKGVARYTANFTPPAGRFADY